MDEYDPKTKPRKPFFDMMASPVASPLRPTSTTNTYHSPDVNAFSFPNAKAPSFLPSPNTTVYFKSSSYDADDMYSKYRKKRRNPWQPLYYLILVASTLFLVYYYVVRPDSDLAHHTDDEYLENHHKFSQVIVGEDEIEELIQKDEQDHQKAHVDSEDAVPYEYITNRKQGDAPEQEIEQEIVELSDQKEEERPDMDTVEQANVPSEAAEVAPSVPDVPVDKAPPAQPDTRNPIQKPVTTRKDRKQNV